MSNPISLSPKIHHVFNEFDHHGVTLNLPRLAGEDNATYKKRLMDVFVHKANSTYTGLVNGITRELGLSFFDAMTIEAKKDSNGDYLLTNPSIEFDGNICRLVQDADPRNRTILLEIDRMDRTSDSYFIGGLIQEINDTGFFTATASDGVDLWARSMQIFNQSLVKIAIEPLDLIDKQIKLEYGDIIPGTVTLQSQSLTQRVSSVSALKKKNQYYIDLTAGIIHTLVPPSDDSNIVYSYIAPSFVVKASPVILHNIQREPFRSKMFTQILDEFGDYFSGAPSILGVDIINELYSVVPMYWGR